MKTMNKLLLCILLMLFTSKNFAQEFSLNTDFVNRYIWRGLDLGGDAPSIQPNIKLTISNFTIGFWGAYPIFKDAALNEIDIYATYSFSLSNAGSISFGLTDYTNPDNGVKFFNFANHDSHNGPGAHSIEFNANYTGPENFPLTLSANIFVHNVANNPIYLQLGYATNLNGVGINLFIGATPGDENSYYLTNKFNIINAGFTVSKTLSITSEFNLPIFGSIILNPSQENIFYVIGITL
ncbi:TorF family putative porin [Rosettibacter firmus]|uniref:TorF family putative porin n=1 Tax=Rosettibacter firmus TaxID=3111522 RepID=UPI00336BC668